MSLREQVAGAELEPQLNGKRRKPERDDENGAYDQSAMPGSAAQRS